MMHRESRERGATLIMIIGVIATLAILAAALTVVVNNMQANTADTRTRDKAQGVAEAAMDGELYALSEHWPETATPSPAPTLDTSTVLSQFPAAEFPRGAGGAFVSAVYYDNSSTSGQANAAIDPANSPNWDANGDGRMFVQAQGTVGKRSARVMALVERTYVNAWFPQGHVVVDGGDMTSNGVGGQVRVYKAGSAGTIYSNVFGTVDTTSVFSGVVPQIGTANTKTFADLVPDTTVQQVIVMAQGMHRYFDLTAGDSLPADNNWGGVTVIKASPGQTVDLPQNQGINMDGAQGAVPLDTDSPGILFILGDPVVMAQGHTNFYGVFYTDGQLGARTGQSYAGTPTFYGMVICKRYMDVRGTCNILYDDNAIMKLRQKYTLTVTVVPNTWREIQPH